MSETLVLDQSYQPLARVPWQKAIVLLFTDKVEVVEHYSDREVRSVSVTIKMPSVVRFLKKIKRRKRPVKFSRENVYNRDGGKCQYCSKDLTKSESTYDHVLPKSRGGKTDWDNIVIACGKCNQKKRNRTPEEAGMHLKCKPYKPKYLPSLLTFTFSWHSTE